MGSSSWSGLLLKGDIVAFLWQWLHGQANAGRTEDAWDANTFRAIPNRSTPGAKELQRLLVVVFGGGV